MENLKEELKKYGQVDQCEEKDGMLHIKITKGFHRGLSNTYDVARIIKRRFGHIYPEVHRMVTDNNLFHLILKKS